MAGLMQRRKQRPSDVAFVDARGDPDVTRGKRRAKRMMRPVEPPTLEVVAHLRSDPESELELGFFAERAMQATVIRRRLVRNGAHQRRGIEGTGEACRWRDR